MQSVPRAVLIAIVAAPAVGLVAASALDRDTARVAAGPSRPALLAGRSLQSARCGDWRAATARQRLAATRALAGTVGGPSGNARGTTLPDDQAIAMFDRACASPIARHFVLYELYTRAAAFRSLAPPAD